jgi:hypothetical protein
MSDNNIVDPNSSAANVGAAILVSFIQDTRSMLKGMNLSTMAVGTSDAGAYFNNLVMAACDFGVRFYLAFLFSFGLLAFRWLTCIHGLGMSALTMQRPGHGNSSSRLMYQFLQRCRISLLCILLRPDGLP